MGYSPRDDLRFAWSGAFLASGTLGFPVHAGRSSRSFFLASFSVILSDLRNAGKEKSRLVIKRSHLTIFVHRSPHLLKPVTILSMLCLIPSLL